MTERESITRQELVELAQAMEEWGDEYSGPHLASNAAFAERLRELLRRGGDEWIIIPADLARELES